MENGEWEMGKWGNGEWGNRPVGEQRRDCLKKMENDRIQEVWKYALWTMVGDSLSLTRNMTCKIHLARCFQRRLLINHLYFTALALPWAPYNSRFVTEDRTPSTTLKKITRLS